MRHGTLLAAVLLLLPVSVSAQSTPQQHGATILNPQKGAIVRPGEILHIDAVLDAGIPSLRAGVVGELGIANEIRDAPPYSFTVSIPEDGDIGIHTFHLVGSRPGQNGDELASIDVDVEEPDLPVELYQGGSSVTLPDGSNLPPPGSHRFPLSFFGLGWENRISVLGKFPDGKDRDITKSTHLTSESVNRAIVRAYEEGLTVSMGLGESAVVYTYTLGRQAKQLTVHVRVEASRLGLVANPSAFDFGDQPVGTVISRRIVIENTRNEPVKIYELSGSEIEDQNCTHTTLLAGGSCTITIRFTPFERGPFHGTLDVTTGNGDLAIPFAGTGN
jgi:hypothetical protein